MLAASGGHSITSVGCSCHRVIIPPEILTRQWFFRDIPIPRIFRSAEEPSAFHRQITTLSVLRRYPADVLRHTDARDRISPADPFPSEPVFPKRENEEMIRKKGSGDDDVKPGVEGIEHRDKPVKYACIPGGGHISRRDRGVEGELLEALAGHRNGHVCGIR